MVTKDYYKVIAACLKWDNEYFRIINHCIYNNWHIIGPELPLIYKSDIDKDSIEFLTIEEALEYIDVQST